MKKDLITIGLSSLRQTNDLERRAANGERGLFKHWAANKKVFIKTDNLIDFDLKIKGN
jgi:hypothetical protein